MRIAFFVNHCPVPQPRQRHALIGGHVRNYTPANHPVQAFKSAVQVRAKQAYQGLPLIGPLRVSLTFLMPRPKRLIWKTKDMPREWAPTNGRNDFDNLSKSALDSLSGIMWEDDGQICKALVEKLYAAGDEEAGVYVQIESLK